jgi:hypothetical protein
MGKHWRQLANMGLNENKIVDNCFFFPVSLNVEFTGTPQRDGSGRN